MPEGTWRGGALPLLGGRVRVELRHQAGLRGRLLFRPVAADLPGALLGETPESKGVRVGKRSSLTKGNSYFCLYRFHGVLSVAPSRYGSKWVSRRGPGAAGAFCPRTLYGMPSAYLPTEFGTEERTELACGGQKK